MPEPYQLVWPGMDDRNGYSLLTGCDRIGYIRGMVTDHPLKTYRKNEQLTQGQLADRLGVNRTTLARWETGSRRPDRNLLVSISAKTGVPPRELRPDLAEIIDGAD